jgi:hypothetical protein
VFVVAQLARCVAGLRGRVVEVHAGRASPGLRTLSSIASADLGGQVTGIGPAVLSGQLVDVVVLIEKYALAAVPPRQQLLRRLPAGAGSRRSGRS